LKKSEKVVTLKTKSDPAPTSAREMEVFLSRVAGCWTSDAQEGFGRPTKTDPQL